MILKAKKSHTVKRERSLFCNSYAESEVAKLASPQKHQNCIWYFKTGSKPCPHWVKPAPRFVAAIHFNNLKSLKLQDNHTGNTTSTSVRRVTLKVTCSLCWIAGGEWWSTLEKLECLNSVIMGGRSRLQCCLTMYLQNIIHSACNVPRNISANVQKMATIGEAPVLQEYRSSLLTLIWADLMWLQLVIFTFNLDSLVKWCPSV